MNTERFKKLHDRLTAEPETLGMGDWESDCGTTRCVAGWGVWDEIKVPIFNHPDWTVSEEFERLAGRLGVYPVVGDVAAELLGLTPVDHTLFFAGPEKATEFVRLAAEGRDAEARSVIGVNADGSGYLDVV